MERTGAREAGAYYLMCERRWVYHLLMIAAGIFGAYTYLLRGGVFCNAQDGATSCSWGWRSARATGAARSTT